MRPRRLIGHFHKDLRKIRRTLVEEEKWALIDSWYYCTRNTVLTRIENASSGLGIPETTLVRYRNHYLSLTQRLAHQCPDGRIRAPYYTEFYRGRKTQKVHINGKCSHCAAKLTDGLKAIILLDNDI